MYSRLKTNAHDCRFSSNLGTFSSNLYILAIVEWPKCDKIHQSTLVAMYSRMGFSMRYGASLGLQILDLQFEDSYWRFYYICTYLASIIYKWGLPETLLTRSQSLSPQIVMLFYVAVLQGRPRFGIVLDVVTYFPYWCLVAVIGCCIFLEIG